MNGTYEMWLLAQNVPNVGTAFLRTSPDTTLTIPSTASLVVTVAAYDARTFSYAEFFGRGPASLYEGEGAKPDLAAPGVRITAPVAQRTAGVRDIVCGGESAWKYLRHKNIKLDILYEFDIIGEYKTEL